MCLKKVFTPEFTEQQQSSMYENRVVCKKSIRQTNVLTHGVWEIALILSLDSPLNCTHKNYWIFLRNMLHSLYWMSDTVVPIYAINKFSGINQGKSTLTYFLKVDEYPYIS